MATVYGAECPSHVLAQVRVGANVMALFPDPKGYVKRQFKMRVIRLDQAKQEVLGVVLLADPRCPFREGDEVAIPMRDMRAIVAY